MNFHDFAKAHRSIRKYQNKTIPNEVLERVLITGTMASTSGNMQAYSIIVTTDKSLKEELLAPHFNQEMVTSAPVLITFCADFHRMREWMKISGAENNFDNFMSFMIASIDATLASQNVALAAESEGLGICYMGTTLASCNEIGRILKLPKNVVPIVGFSMGYPDETPEFRERLPMNAIIHRETYKKTKLSDIQEFYSKKERSGFKRYMEVPALKSEIERLNIDNLAKVYTSLKYTEQSHITYSKTVLDYISSQNFM